MVPEVPRRVARFAVAGILAAAVPAWSASLPMGEADARHLLSRTGFGPTAADVRTFASLSRDEGVDRVLAATRTRVTAVTPPPAWTAETGPLRPAAAAAPEERRDFARRQALRVAELRAWWVQEMLATPSPLTERLTLFWHNHFVSSQQKVRVARLMYAQNALYRSEALGNFATLLHAAAKDPAMVVYLDSAQNRKGAPNENFAREVMELFTLGQGHYGEQDVKEAARAFTGWSLDRDTGTFLFRPRLHDDGDKTVLGRTGRFDGDAVLDVLLARPETAELVVGKLWQELVSPVPDAREVARIARAFRAANYEIIVPVRELLRSAAFWAPAQRGALVKSPVDLVVGALRQLDQSPADTRPYALAVAGMGQNLFAPPNVRGWPGGDAWINSNTLLARKQFVDRLARSDAVVMELAKAPAAQRVLLPIAPQLPSPPDADAALAIRTTLLDPAYQLK